MREIAVSNIKIHFKNLYDSVSILLNWIDRKKLLEQNQSAEVDLSVQIFVYAKGDTMKKLKKYI